MFQLFLASLRALISEMLSLFSIRSSFFAMVYPTLLEADGYNKDRQIEETIFFCNFMAHIHGITSKYSRFKLEVVKEDKDRHCQAQIDILVIF